MLIQCLYDVGIWVAIYRVNIALRRFLHNHGNNGQKEAQSRDCALLLSNDFKDSL